jgi:hypothetical protein
MNPLLLIAIPLTLALVLPVLVSKTIQKSAAGSFEDEGPLPELETEKDPINVS